MQLTAGQFPDVESAYRSERITASFRDHAAARHRHLFRRQRGSATSNIRRRSLRAA